MTSNTSLPDSFKDESPTDNKRPLCSLCEEVESKVWTPVYGAVCSYFNEHGYCKSEEQICEMCGKGTSRLKRLYFIGGPMVCWNCREKEFCNDLEW